MNECLGVSIFFADTIISVSATFIMVLVIGLMRTFKGSIFGLSLAYFSKWNNSLSDIKPKKNTQMSKFQGTKEDFIKTI